MARRLTSLLPLVVLLLASACGGSVRDNDSQLEYSVSARQNYERGQKALEDEDWTEAAKYFAFVKARFPYSKYAVLAELGLADALFGSGAYLEAVDSYKQFIKFHPTHEKVTDGYAAYRVGEGYYRMLPEDWFLVPPSHEKDPAATMDAERELASFLKKHPSSTYLDKVKKMHAESARLLAAHEWYVAKFYWDRDKPQGTILRLRTLLDRYPGVGYDEEALWLLGSAYRDVGKPKEARAAWEQLIAKFPNHRRAAEARGQIAKLAAK